jgi:SAM-dependent methyltransferase
VIEGYDASFLDDDHRFHVGYLTEERADLEATEALGLLELGGPSRVIDAGCGDGRLSVRLAALGHEVVAIDVDPAQVDRARAAAERRGVALDLRVADLRREVVDPPADGALLWFTTFGFLADEDNLAVLSNLRRGLRTGARLVVDTLDPSVVAAEVGADPRPVAVEVDGFVQEDRRSFDDVHRRLLVERTVRGPGVETSRVLRLWLPSRQEWSSVLASVGFVLDEVVEPADDAWAIRVVALAAPT